MIHNLILAVDALDVDSIEEGLQKLDAESERGATSQGALGNTLPTQ